MNMHNLHIDFTPDGVQEYVIVERALDGSQGLSSSAADYQCALFSPPLTLRGYGKRSLRSF